MKVLTRDQAIKRINDLSMGKCDKSHFDIGGEKGPEFGAWMEIGAVRELMAIFDIKEDEL